MKNILKMIRARDFQELAIEEMEAIPNKGDRELLEGIAEILIVMELRQWQEKEQSKG